MSGRIRRSPRRNAKKFLSHVTGGGLAANIARVLPQGVHARLDRSTWVRPAVFDLVAELGRVPQSDLERTLNLGVGFAAVVAPEAVDAAIAHLQGKGIETWVLGEIFAADGAPVEDGVEVVHGAKGVDGGSVQLVGQHP